MSERLRQWVMRRGPQDEATRLFRSFWILDHWLWIDTAIERDVARYGESLDDPRASERSLRQRLWMWVVVRCDDWRQAAAHMFGRAPWEVTR